MTQLAQQVAPKFMSLHPITLVSSLASPDFRRARVLHSCVNSTMLTNHALLRTQPSRSSCNRGVLLARSLSYDR